MTGVPDRLRWALDLVDPGPDEVLLEVGCGGGVAAGLVCDRLVTGRLLAIDRSATAVGRAVRRNAGHVAAGRLEVRQCELRELVVPTASLHAAFAVDVNLFWTRSPAAELAVLGDALRPDGRVHLLYGAGPTGPDRAVTAVAAALEAAGFEAVAAVSSPAGFGVSATRR